MFCLWPWGGTSWYYIPFFSIAILKSSEHSLSKMCIFGMIRDFFNQPTRIWYICTNSPNVQILNCSARIALPSNLPCTNVNGIKIKPDLLRYCHTVAGFPTKPTWLAAIKNNHHASRTGLSSSDVEKHFPEAEETWKGHGKDPVLSQNNKIHLSSTIRQATILQRNESKNQRNLHPNV